MLFQKLFFMQALVTLRYLSKADFFSKVGDLHGISKSSVSRIVHTGNFCFGLSIFILNFNVTPQILHYTCTCPLCEMKQFIIFVEFYGYSWYNSQQQNMSSPQKSNTNADAERLRYQFDYIFISYEKKNQILHLLIQLFL